MKYLLLSIALCMSAFAHADTCKTILSLETDDALYPGHGEVKLCTNGQNQATKLIVIKPVQNPQVKDSTSDQADERNPIVQITLDEINKASNDIAILTPSRMGIQVKAALLEVPKSPINKDSGGEIVLKVLKSKIVGSYHHFKLRLVKEGNEWKAYLIENNQKTPLSRSFFSSGMSGIKKVEFY